jgi:hypothetical protein
VLRHIHVDQPTTAGIDAVLWVEPAVGNTDYFFNNLVYDFGKGSFLNIGNSGTNYGSETFFNNTWQSNLAQSVYNCQNMLVGTVTIINDHAITDGGTYLSSPTCNGRLGTSTPVLFTNNSTANSTGYTNLQTFAYSPISGSSPTVGAGTNQQSFCTTMLGSSDALVQAAGTACQSDTTYAVSYNATNHTASFPARTVVARPVSATWDKGAYEFPTTPAPIATFMPNPLNIGQVPVGLTSNPSVTTTLQNTGTANLVVTSVAPGAIYTLVNNTCGTSFTLTPGSSCTFQVTATPTSAVSFTGGISFSDNAGNPDVLPITGIGTGSPALTNSIFAQSVILTTGII